MFMGTNTYTCIRTVVCFSFRLFLSQPEMWKKCLDCIDELLDILFANNNIFIGENIAEDSENLAISDQVIFFKISPYPEKVLGEKICKVPP